MSQASIPELIRAILAQYELPRFGLHGVTHWARVYENGLRLAPQTGAEENVLLYFALFHDACRISEGWDHGHGRRGAQLAASLRGSGFQLSDRQFALLVEACTRHTDGLLDGDPTVQTCWDADRLDLARAGIQPQPDQLCTEAARRPEVIAWASARSLARTEPDFLQPDWLGETSAGPGGPE